MAGQHILRRGQIPVQTAEELRRHLSVGSGLGICFVGGALGAGRGEEAGGQEAGLGPPDPLRRGAGESSDIFV